MFHKIVQALQQDLNQKWPLNTKFKDEHENWKEADVFAAADAAAVFWGHLWRTQQETHTAAQSELCCPEQRSLLFFSFDDVKKKGKKVGRTCLPNGSTALPYLSAGLEEECWKSGEGKSASPSVTCGGGGGAPGTTDQKLMAWSSTPDLAVQRWQGSRRRVAGQLEAVLGRWFSDRRLLRAAAAAASWIKSPQVSRLGMLHQCNSRNSQKIEKKRMTGGGEEEGEAGRWGGEGGWAIWE